MKSVCCALLVGVAVCALAVSSSAQEAVPLPPGVQAVWDLDKAFREATPTRERVCINGLWRWQPAVDDTVPKNDWGYFKVPGPWPGARDYLRSDSQTVFAHPSWKQKLLTKLDAAWYQRTITIPKEWTGRRTVLSAEYVNSLAIVFIDGKRAGEIRFPAGEVDLSGVCKPGQTHELTMRVAALPLADVVEKFNDSATAKRVAATVGRKGLCGDVFLISTPAGPRFTNVKVEPMVRARKLRVSVGIEGVEKDATFGFSGHYADGPNSIGGFEEQERSASELHNGRATFDIGGLPEILWDLNTPLARCTLQLSLRSNGKVVDQAWDVQFGFREFWIDGRDFYLNGRRIFLSAVPLDNAQIGAAWADYEGAKKTLERLKAIGINFVYTHHYDCMPGSHLSLTEVLRAADDVGMLVAITQPHFGQYDWSGTPDPNADDNSTYARHAAFYVRAAENHPSVVAFSTSHNGTGYSEDMNPDLMDGKYSPTESWSVNNRKKALRAEGIIKRLDSTRIVYHHAGGNLGEVFTANFYPNFTPAQEMSEWFGHWAAEGNKPMFPCEYGVPFTWDWGMYRGWYKGKREFGSAEVPWDLCMAEWNAQFFGDKAFDVSDIEKTDLRWQAKQFRAGKGWHRWDYPVQMDSPDFAGRQQVIADYLTANWRAFRTLGVSGISPWQFGHFWTLKPGVDRSRKQLKVDWQNLQRPGFSPDFIDHPPERVDLAYEMTDWKPTPAGEALLRNNQPVLAYIAGSPAAFTAKDHNFFTGQIVEKSIVVINNSRRPIECDCEWAIDLPEHIGSKKHVSLETGQMERIQIAFQLPFASVGSRELQLKTRFADGSIQLDQFSLDVLARPKADAPVRIAIFDPKGETTALLNNLGIPFRKIEANEKAQQDELLVIGKMALSIDGPAPDLTAVRDGLRAIVFEQSSQALEKRLGFRVVEYGLRQVFPRTADHPLLAGLSADNLRDWRGEATTTSSRLKYEMIPMHGPTVKWCDIPVTRVWRCGNRGNVASVLIEKPPRGDFLPIVDGGFNLQYCPLMEYRDGKGVVLFCQLDVTGRTESDPAAQIITRNLLNYASQWKPQPRRNVAYAGDAAGLKNLESAGVKVASFKDQELPPGETLLVIDAAAAKSKDQAAKIRKFADAGGSVLAIGIDKADAAACFSPPVEFRQAEHISAVLETFALSSPLAGISSADVYNSDPRQIPLVQKQPGVLSLGDGVLGEVVAAKNQQSRIVLFQMEPWQFDPTQSPNVKRTFRRVSFTLSRLLCNLGAAESTSLLDRFNKPATATERRWADGLYLDTPEEWDDPYRFFRW